MPKVKKKAAASPRKKPAKEVVRNDRELFFHLFAGALILSWLLFCGVTITFSQYNWENPFHYELQLGSPAWQSSLLFFAIMLVFAWFVRKQESSFGDIPGVWSFSFLGLILVSAFWLCFYCKDIPINNYAEDTSLNMYLPIHLRDTDNYRGAFILNYGVLPLWPYTALLLYHIFPGLHALAIQRLTGTVFDLGTIILLYQIGKELGGRRAGLYCAAMGLVGRPLLFRVVSGFNYSTAPFAVACVLWATLRLIRKDSRAPFITWAALIGVAACSSFPIQPVLIFFIFASLVLIWWVNRQQMRLNESGPWIWLSMPVFLAYTVYCVGCLPIDQWVGDGNFRLNQPNVALALVVLGILLALAYRFGYISLKKEDHWNQWLFGAWLALLFSFPAMTHWDVIDRIREHGLAGTGYEIDYLSPGYIFKAMQHVPDTLRAMFLGMVDPPDTSLAGDPFFSYSETILLALGLVFCAVKPDTKRMFVLIVALIGVVPFFFAGLNHSGLLLCCLAPFWVIAGMGLEELTQLLFAKKTLRFLWPVLLVLFSVFCAWSVQKDKIRVYDRWAYPYWDNLQFRSSALADMQMKGQRVYLSQQFNFWRRAYFNFDGNTFYAWNEVENSIYQAPGEELPNVVIYFNGYDDAGVPKRLFEAFPEAHFEILGSPMVNKGSYAYRCEIPAALIMKKKNPLLMVKSAPADHWERTWGINGFGLNFSAISWKDEVANANTPIVSQYANANYYDDIFVRLQGTIHVAQSGIYEVSCFTGNRTICIFDQKKIFDLSFLKLWDYAAPPATHQEKIRMEKGDHQVEVITYLQNGSFALPNLTIKAPGTSQGSSLWNGYSF